MFHTKKVVLGLSLFVAVPLSAYTYTFRNLIDKNILVSFQLVGGINEPTETVIVPAMQNGVPGVATRSFGGLRAGLCTNTKTFKVAILPDMEALTPYFWGITANFSSKQYQEYLRTRVLSQPSKMEQLFDYYTTEERAKFYKHHPITCDSIIEFSTAFDGYPVVAISTGA